MTDRVMRITPIYWFLTGLFFLISIITPSIVDGFPAGISWMTSSFLCISQPVMGVEAVFYVGWILEYEMLFYVIFAVSIALINSLPSYLLVLIMLISLHVFFGVSLLVLEFFIGMLIGYFYLRLSIKEKTGHLISLLGLIGLLISIWLVDIDRKGLRLLIWGVPGCLMVLGAIYAKQLQSKLFILLGDSSYSIYLIQVFTIPIFYKGLSWLEIGSGSSDFLAVCSLALTAATGVLSYLFLERPLGAYLKIRLS